MKVSRWEECKEPKDKDEALCIYEDYYLGELVIFRLNGYIYKYDYDMVVGRYYILLGE